MTLPAVHSGFLSGPASWDRRLRHPHQVPNMPWVCGSLSVEKGEREGTLVGGGPDVVRYPQLAAAYGTGPQLQNLEPARPPCLDRTKPAVAGVSRAANLESGLVRWSSRLDDK